uniref:Putative short d7 salivary protein n=1 Tax=Psorophora albipes TaxID=869069 RepID=T1DFE8_9DIPT
MKNLILFSALILTIHASPPRDNVFRGCVQELYLKSSDKPIVCRISKFDVDGNIRNIGRFYDCVFVVNNLYKKYTTKLQLDAVVKALKPFGPVSEADVDEVVHQCKEEYPNITGLEYLTCFLSDAKTKKAFKKLMISSDETFFKKDHCN